MRRSAAVLALAMLLAAVPSSGASAQSVAAGTAAAPVAPDVGQLAPDFTAAWADGTGPKATPVSLSALRGKVVVLAFYPKDRTSGCTAELTKFRDEYATMFGKEVVVLPISADSIASHVAWGQEMKFPFGLVSDPTLSLAESYGSRSAGRPFSNRTVFVIGKDGRIVYRELKFNALNEGAYSQLASAVATAAKS